MGSVWQLKLGRSRALASHGATSCSLQHCCPAVGFQGVGQRSGHAVRARCPTHWNLPAGQHCCTCAGEGRSVGGAPPLTAPLPSLCLWTLADGWDAPFCPQPPCPPPHALACHVSTHRCPIPSPPCRLSSPMWFVLTCILPLLRPPSTPLQILHTHTQVLLSRRPPAPLV